MIPPDLYERYGAALDGAADAVAAAVEELFGRLEGLSGAEYENALDAGYRSLVALYGQAAAEAAVEFYAAVRSAQGVGGGFAPTAPQGAGQRGLSADVARALAAKESAPAVLSGSAVKRAMERADGAIEANAARDPAKPRWARVPHAGACGWCVMIGSRGFAYLSKEKADAVRHANCRCRTVVDFERNPGLEGYDPERLYRSYSECRAAVSGDAERAWAAMGDAERARYKSYSHYQRNRIVSEMNSRDRNWLMTGEPSKVARQAGAKPLGKEIKLAESLSKHGFEVEFIREANKTGVKTADACVCGRLTEFKLPEGWSKADANSVAGEHTVRKQFFKTLGKGTDRLVISCDEAPVGFEEFAGVVSKVFYSGYYPIRDCIAASSREGLLVRLTR